MRGVKLGFMSDSPADDACVMSGQARKLANKTAKKLSDSAGARAHAAAETQPSPVAELPADLPDGARADARDR